MSTSARYNWITFADARKVLASRLADSGNRFWTDTECGLYLVEALRTWNALTEVWNAEYAFTAKAGDGTWFDVSAKSSSPRLRTVNDADLYTMMQYHLLEPATGAGTWTGTGQFSLADLQQSLQHRRDEVIQLAGCNLVQLSVASVPNVRRAQFADTVLEARRARFVPASNFGNPATLMRQDELAFDYFEPDHLQMPQTPSAWSVVAGPPLAMDVDTAPNIPGSYDVIALQSGPTFTPPASTLLSIPDDWSWVCKWGALSDLLGRESEATDKLRADYCLKRYTQGIQIMQQANWLLLARINGVPVDTPSLATQDAYAPEWEQDAGAWPAVVTVGMDYIAPCPLATTDNPVGVTLTLVGNAPVPVNDSDSVQASRDTFDAIVGYAMHLATFKQGGAEFMQTASLMEEFFSAAMATNKRLMQSGAFVDLLRSQGKREEKDTPRF